MLEQTLELQEALEEMDDVYDVFGDFDVHILSYSNKARQGIEDCDELLSELPSTNMGNNRDDETEQEKVEAWFPFDFAAYIAAIDELNLELAKMSYIPTPFHDQYAPSATTLSRCVRAAGPSRFACSLLQADPRVGAVPDT